MVKIRCEFLASKLFHLTPATRRLLRHDIGRDISLKITDGRVDDFVQKKCVSDVISLARIITEPIIIVNGWTIKTSKWQQFNRGQWLGGSCGFTNKLDDQPIGARKDIIVVVIVVFLFADSNILITLLARSLVLALLCFYSVSSCN